MHPRAIKIELIQHDLPTGIYSKILLRAQPVEETPMASKKSNLRSLPSPQPARGEQGSKQRRKILRRVWDAVPAGNTFW